MILLSRIFSLYINIVINSNFSSGHFKEQEHQFKNVEFRGRQNHLRRDVTRKNQ